MKTFLQKYYHLVCIAVIMIISFCFYSYLRYPLLNSDDAWVVLMAQTFHLPDDLFYWNQNRGGNIVPMLAQIFMGVGFRAITAVSIAEYLLLLVGVLCFGTLFKRKSSKIMLAIIFFLPFQRFIDITRFFIGWEYCILAVVVMLLNKLWDMDKTTLKAKIFMCLTMLFIVIDIWVLYNALFSIIVLLCVLILYNGKRLPHKNVILFSIIGGIISIALIKYIYSFNHAECENCNEINALKYIISAILVLVEDYRCVLIFRAKEYFVSIHAWLCVAFFLTTIFFIIKKKWYKTLIKDKWITFFFLDFCAFYGIYLLSHWVYLNYMGRWYYVACYISMSMCVLLIFDRLHDDKITKALRIFLYIVLFVGAISPVGTMLMNRPQNLKPMERYANELEPLGKCGIIGEWWNAYICSIAHPDKVLSTPHQDDWAYTRNPERAKQVAAMDTIYLVKDGWLEEFPQTTEQFGYKFQKQGEEFHLGDWTLCKYSNEGKIEEP